MPDIIIPTFDAKDHAHYARCALALQAQRDAKLSWRNLATVLAATSWPFLILALVH